MTALTFDFVKDPARLLGCSTDGSRAWFAARMGSNTRGIYELDLSALRVTKAVWSDPDFDFDGELLVKRGDTVKRGQIIGRAGQTGNVTSPQLHFEIRKGSTPVDPNQFLGG